MSISKHPIAMPVADVINHYPRIARNYALGLHDFILEIAEQDARIGPLTETLKWREPAYLTESSKSGTTLRFDWKEKHPGKMGVFVNCKTTLIRSFRDQFQSELEYEGSRAIWLDINKPLPRNILAICIGKTLTYHLDKV